MQSSMLHGSETWLVRKENEMALQWVEIHENGQMDLWH